MEGGDERRRDIDFTYLELPTYVLEIKPDIPADKQLKSLMEVSELREKGEISNDDFLQYMAVLTGFDQQIAELLYPDSKREGMGVAHHIPSRWTNNKIGLEKEERPYRP